MILETETEVEIPKSVYVPTYIQVPHASNWDWNHVFVLTGWPLAAWSKERKVGTKPDS
jgi:hypothetical protein